MTKKISILSTKNLLPNQKQRLLDANFCLFEEDFISIKNKKVLSKGEDLGKALIFTSQNAVQSVLQNRNSEDLKSKNIFCVGTKTKLLLEENGFKVVEYVDYAVDLATIILSKYKHLCFTFFCGNLRQDILPNKLKKNGIVFNEIEVYETVLTPKKVTCKVDAILFFSPSGVESYLKENKITSEVCFCIGNTTAKKLKQNKTAKIVVSKEPKIEELINELIKHYI